MHPPALTRGAWSRHLAAASRKGVGGLGLLATVVLLVGGVSIVASPAGAATDCGRIFVTNNAPMRVTPTVAEFAPGANGNATPVNSITGGRNSQLLTPEGIAQDAQGFTYVANANTATITVYSPGATGDAAPFATLSGASTGLLNPAGLAIQNNKLYVVNGPFPGFGAPSVTVYGLSLAAGANNVAPLQTITGAATGLDVPFAVVLDAAGDIFVSNVNDAVTEYAPGATGNAAPISTIVGPHTMLTAPEGLAIRGGRLYVANDSNIVTEYVLPLAAGANDLAPVVTISGANTGLNAPLGLAFDAAGNLYVVNGPTTGTPSVTEYAPAASGNATPIATITGTNTTLDRPQFVLIGACTTPPPAGGGAFRPLPPTRILDTRSGPGPVGALAPGATLDLQMTGVGGIPATGVSAVVFNVTAVGSTAPGYLTVYPTGSPRPTSANLNYGTGETVPNLVEVAVGAGGKVSLYNGSSGSTNYVVDVAGWVTTPDAASGPDGRYNPLSPARILDTRAASPVNSTGTPLHTSPDLSLVVTGKGGVPSTGVSAVVLNVAVTNPSGAGYLTVYPAGGAAPLAANVNFTAGQTVSNRVVVAVGSGGAVNFHLGGSATSADVIADVSGWFTDATSAAGGSLFSGLTPNRVADTRAASQVGPKNTPLGPGQTMTVTVAGTPGVPAMGASNAPKAVVLNVAVTNTTASSYLTVFPSGEAQPTAADLNWAPGATRSNLVVAKVGADGAVKIYNNAGNADVIVDVLGWYS